VRTAIAAALPILLLAAACGGPANAAPAPPAFPESWAGTWKGDLRILSPGRPEQTVPMEIVIGAAAEAGRWRWAIRYGEQPVRDYRLAVLDAAAGKCEIDERNGIVLPATQLGGELLSLFAVSGSRIEARYRLEGDVLRFEILSSAAEAGGRTGGRDGVPEVAWYAVRGLQRAELRRQ
jgi:hypothetical protein